MRHRKNKKTLDRGSAHRNDLIRNLVRSFIVHGRIKTTITKAKVAKPAIEKVITLGKKNTLHTRRQLIGLLGTNTLAEKVLKEISPKYAQRNGGYTRIIKIGLRKGDAASIVYLALV